MYSAVISFVVIYAAILIWIKCEITTPIELDEHENEISK